MDSESEIAANNSENVGWRIGALFAILFFGAFGSILPSVLTRFTKLTTSHNAFLIGKAFGTGVVLGTAYIHIMPDAGEDVKEGINCDYPLSALFALISTIIVMFIEQAANDAFSKISHSNYQIIQSDDDNEILDHEDHTHVPLITNEMNGKTRVIAYLLEFGIAVHSVIIGLALGCQTNISEIRALMIALCFHQTFEGFALGASMVQANLSLIKNIIMVCIFSTTTPIGIAIGIGITGGQNAESKSLHATQGIFDSIAFGILIYMALVDMFSEDFALLKALKKGKGMKYGFIFAFALGAGVMAFIGLWA